MSERLQGGEGERDERVWMVYRARPDLPWYCWQLDDELRGVNTPHDNDQAVIDELRAQGYEVVEVVSGARLAELGSENERLRERLAGLEPILSCWICGGSGGGPDPATQCRHCYGSGEDPDPAGAVMAAIKKRDERLEELRSDRAVERAARALSQSEATETSEVARVVRDALLEGGER